ncbi:MULTISPECIES: hypothetical protein [unclassified Neorhizobium]|uniref:hypothetical protein n=1 Tax=unclassified Neorhizobium TaxID=2629175 RepID=UPI001FF1E4CD|nr:MULTISPECIES: hypothetical protein [unclassified Neorhizobium]MCJ9669436.1 hypothetical protein [Neorhizobium sp. SHOUNA12B]MCJ9745539.1 hypothetical protein [Neorhizobium sp. SHOUNA12A]
MTVAARLATEGITQIQELTSDGRSRTIDRAIDRLDKLAPKDQSFEAQSAVLDDTEAKELVGAVMRMGQYWNSEQQQKIINLSEKHSGLETLMREEIIAKGSETKPFRNLDQRSPRSSSSDRV